jgi:hypothetical protein
VSTLSPRSSQKQDGESEARGDFFVIKSINPGLAIEGMIAAFSPLRPPIELISMTS